MKLNKTKHNAKSNKLILDLYKKEKYLIHYRYLQKAVELGYVVTKIHQTIEFKQSKWLEPYISKNTAFRQEKGNSKFLKDLYKLLNNIEPGNIYTFNQLNSLNGNQIQIGKIDTAMFLFDFSLNDVKEIKWVNNDYMADGQYILNIYNLHKNKWIYVNNINCYYNFLN